MRRGASTLLTSYASLPFFPDYLLTTGITSGFYSQAGGDEIIRGSLTKLVDNEKRAE